MGELHTIEKPHDGIRRTLVPGGYLYQMSTGGRGAAWSAPVFVPDITQAIAASMAAMTEGFDDMIKQSIATFDALNEKAPCSIEVTELVR